MIMLSSEMPLQRQGHFPYRQSVHDPGYHFSGKKVQYFTQKHLHAYSEDDMITMSRGISRSLTDRKFSWKDSSLRTYLNETVLEHEFTPAETAAMVAQTPGPTENVQYGTKLEESVEDLVSILSVEQAQAYQEKGILKSTSADMWLRTPGHDMGSASYMTSNGNIILYGNDVKDDSLSVCPLILVDSAKLEG